MCGIVGIHYFDSQRTVAEATLLRMNATIRHRGPDDAGHAIFGSTGLAMRRLSIIDLSSGHQPLSNEDDSVWIVFNGEIYNFQELREDLVGKGHIFRTHCDTEALVHAYEEYGDDFASRSNGMFGLAIWDKKQERLVLGRDRLGKKPLYYYKDAEKIVFASELKALLAYPELKLEINPLALDEFMTWEYSLGPQTILKNIFKVRPGHLLIIEKGKVEEKPFWSPLVARKEWTEEEAAATLRQTLKEAVRCRMISDVPLGAFLSGGIDSSIIVGLMAELSPQPVKTFSIAFDDKSYNESSYARLVARWFGTEHKEFTLSVDPKKFMDDYTQFLDDLNGDVSLISTFLVSKMARTGVTVALSGDGGDELFAGYDAYSADKLGVALQNSAPAGALAVLGALIGKLPPTRKKKGLINRFKRFFEGLEHPSSIEHTRWMNFLKPSDRARLYTPDFQASLPDRNAYRGIEEYFADAHPTWDRLTRQSFVDLNVYLVEDILNKVDIASMANSLEVRVPFLDYRVVELALSMPGCLKMKGFSRKYILKQAFKDFLPPEILRRKKEGFSIPLKNWLRTDLKQTMTDILNPEAIRAAGFFSWDVVEKMIQEHGDGRQNHAHRLWCLMVFELWRNKYLNLRTAASPACEIEAARASFASAGDPGLYPGRKAKGGFGVMSPRSLANDHGVAGGEAGSLMGTPGFARGAP